jgi:hypothetical protein
VNDKYRPRSEEAAIGEAATARSVVLRRRTTQITCWLMRCYWSSALKSPHIIRWPSKYPRLPAQQGVCWSRIGRENSYDEAILLRRNNACGTA